MPTRKAPTATKNTPTATIIPTIAEKCGALFFFAGIKVAAGGALIVIGGTVVAVAMVPIAVVVVGEVEGGRVLITDVMVAVVEVTGIVGNEVGVVPTSGANPRTTTDHKEGVIEEQGLVWFK